MREPTQVEHTPQLQRDLDKFAEMLGIGAPDPDQSDKNPDCPLEAGTIQCLNAADAMCNFCGWWNRVAAEEETTP